MPSYTEEQRRKAIEAVEECGGSVTRAIRKLGYPSRHTLLCFVNLSFHKTASVRFTRQREDSSRASVALAPILSSPTTPRA